MESYRGGFLVTDGHHNRILRVTLDGEVTAFMAFDNIVPTGLAASGNTVYMAQAGPIPHDPADGKVVSFRPKSPTATEVASGAPLLVDVEFGRGRELYALSQGPLVAVLRVLRRSEHRKPREGQPNGTLTVVVDGLDRPTSLEIIENTAYVVTLAGEIWRIDRSRVRPMAARVERVDGERRHPGCRQARRSGDGSARGEGRKLRGAAWVGRNCCFGREAALWTSSRPRHEYGLPTGSSYQRSAGSGSCASPVPPRSPPPRRSG